VKKVFVAILIAGIIFLAGCNGSSVDMTTNDSPPASEGTAVAESGTTKGTTRTPESNSSTSSTENATLKNTTTSPEQIFSAVDDPDFKHRLIYSQLPIHYIRLVDDMKKVSDWQKELYANGFNSDGDEMLLALFVKKFNITRAQFDKANKEWGEFIGENDLTEYEIPNADIIYTFNSKLISDYYLIKDE